MDNKNILKIINNQKEIFNKWVKELKKELSENAMNSNKSIILYLVKIIWIKNYEQRIFNEQKDINNLINLYINFKLINNDYFFKVTTIKELPYVYPLNENCWSNFIRDKDKEKELIFEGKFYNKLLLFKLMTINNCNIYCFFYLDKKNKINKGYIKINKKHKEKEIIDNLIINGPIKFINN